MPDQLKTMSKVALPFMVFYVCGQLDADTLALIALPFRAALVVLFVSSFWVIISIRRSIESIHDDRRIIVAKEAAKPKKKKKSKKVKTADSSTEIAPDVQDASPSVAAPVSQAAAAAPASEEPLTEEITVEEYDMREWKKFTRSSLIGLTITGGVHWYTAGGGISALVTGCVTTTMTLLDNPLVKLHIMHMAEEGDLVRPWKAEEGMLAGTKESITEIQKMREEIKRGDSGLVADDKQLRQMEDKLEGERQRIAKLKQRAGGR